MYHQTGPGSIKTARAADYSARHSPDAQETGRSVWVYPRKAGGEGKRAKRGVQVEMAGRARQAVTECQVDGAGGGDRPASLPNKAALRVFAFDPGVFALIQEGRVLALLGVQALRLRRRSQGVRFPTRLKKGGWFLTNPLPHIWWRRRESASASALPRCASAPGSFASGPPPGGPLPR